MSIITKLNDLAASVAFAESGQFAYAQELLAHVNVVSKSNNKKFIILSENIVMKKELIQYATSLCESLRYDVVATHVVNEQRPVGLARGGFQKAAQNLKREFLPRYRKMAEYAASVGVACHHLLSRGSARDALSYLQHHIGSVEFAVVQGRMAFAGDLMTGLPLFVFEE